MNISKKDLPSNKSFGYFLSAIFFGLSTYFYFTNSAKVAYILFFVNLFVLSIVIIKPDKLFFFNKLWMKFGIFLGKIFSPVVMGIIFFCLFAPISLITRLFGRDELRIRIKKKSSHWIPIKKSYLKTDVFKKQY